jgi:hypothetical protein
MAVAFCVCGKCMGTVQPYASSVRVVKICSVSCEQVNNKKKKGTRVKTYGSRAVPTSSEVLVRFFARLKST